MKSKVVLFTACMLIFSLSGCHVKAKRAKEYHDKMLRSVQTVIDQSLDYGDGIQSYEKSKAKQAQEKYTGLVQQTLITINAMKDFEGDTTLITYSKELLEFYNHTLKNNMQPFLNSVKEEAFSPEEMQVADSLMTDLNMTESRYWERFNWAEKKFYKEQEIARVEK